MFFDSYRHALSFLEDHYGEFEDVAREADLDVGGRWLHQTLYHEGRNPSEKLRRKVMDHAQAVREEKVEKRAEEDSDVDHKMIEKIKTLHEEYGSWSRVERRTGASANALRLAVKEGASLPEGTRQKIIDASRRTELEEMLGFICVGIGLQMISALEETDLSHDQQKIIDNGAKQLRDYNRLLQTGNMQELRDKIQDSIEAINEPISMPSR